MTAEEFTTALDKLVATAIEAGLSDTEVGSRLERALDALYGLSGSSQRSVDTKTPSTG